MRSVFRGPAHQLAVRMRINNCTHGHNYSYGPSNQPCMHQPCTMHTPATARTPRVCTLVPFIDDSNGEGDEGSDCSNDWTKLASRGGLLFVKDTTYMVFHAMELVVRKHFCKERVEKLLPGSRSMLIQLVCEDEDVSFYSCMLFAEVEESVASILLHSIVKLWVTMRGFAFASSWRNKFGQT